MNLIEEAERLTLQGLYTDAEKLIKAFSKKTSLSPKDRVRISVLKHWNGDSCFSSKMLKNKSIEKDELKYLNNDVLIEYIRETHMLNYSGAFKLASSRYATLEKNFKEKNIPIEKIYPQFFNSLGNHYLQIFNFPMALKSFKKGELFFNKSTSQWFFNKLSQVDALIGMKQFKEAIILLESTHSYAKKNASLAPIHEQVKGELHLKENDMELAYKHLKQSEKQFKESNNRSKDFAYCQMYLGVYYGLVGDMKESKNYFSSAEDLLVGKYYSPLPLVEINKYRELFNIADGKVKIFNNIYPIKIPDSYFCMEIDSNSSTSKNCFYLKENKAIEIDYYDISIDPEKETFDLMSSTIIKDQKIIEHLGQKLSQALYFLLSSEDRGINELILDEAIYKNDEALCEKESPRVRKLIKRLKSYGFDISKKDNYYKLINRHKFNIILPTKLVSNGLFHYVDRSKIIITRKNLESLLNLSRSKTSALLKEWSDTGLILQAHNSTYLKAL